MRTALITGTGKDATLAWRRARDDGHDLSDALVLYDRATDRIRFHGTRLRLVREHLAAMDLSGRLHPSGADDFEESFLTGLDELVEGGVEAVVMGNIHLADVRAWYEERTTAAGLAHLEPLWDEDPAELVREVVDRGIEATVTCVELPKNDGTGDPESDKDLRLSWLGRKLSPDLLDTMEAAGIDPCGEQGEYHTFVGWAPGFGRAVDFRLGDTHHVPNREGGEGPGTEGFRLIDLVPRDVSIQG